MQTASEAEEMSAATNDKLEQRKQHFQAAMSALRTSSALYYTSKMVLPPLRWPQSLLKQELSQRSWKDLVTAFSAHPENEYGQAVPAHHVSKCLDVHITKSASMRTTVASAHWNTSTKASHIDWDDTRPLPRPDSVLTLGPLTRTRAEIKQATSPLVMKRDSRKKPASTIWLT